jgi:hypothetical protein
VDRPASGSPKQSYKIELWNDELEDRDVSIFGLPADSDWILYGPYNFDPAMIRNPFLYTLSNRIGLWAAWPRFIEVFLNTRTGVVMGPVPTGGSYWGVYVFMEKIKRHRGRVDIDRLGPDDVAEPEVSGGYILKIDRADPGDSGFAAAGTTLLFVDPKEEVIERRPEQITWIRNFMNGMRTTLASSDPETGYPSTIDVDSWIDHHILNVFAQNVDALRLSGYMFKRRDGLLEMGPIWDFDRSMDSTDSRDNNPRAWDGTGDATRMFSCPWWSTLFQDPDFDRRYQARWRELRRGEFGTENLVALVDSMADELREAQVRNFARWNISRRGGWEGEIEIMRNWMRNRAEWIDTQFVSRPIIDPPGGNFEAPVEVTLSHDGEPSARMFYTLDRTDPRESPTAVEYQGVPVRLENNTMIQARLFDGSIWSEMVTEAYVFEIPTITVTEIMFNPSGGTNFEFIELYNLGDESVPLRLAGFTRGVSFRFPADGPEFLEPGATVVVANDLDSFRSRYPSETLDLSGGFAGSLNDTSESLRFVGSVDEDVFRITYRDSWYPDTTDGQGHSLVLIDPTTPLDRLGEASRWRPSSFADGSPGVLDPEKPDGGQIPGDASQDGLFNLSDGIRVLLFLFEGGRTLPCGDGTASAVSNARLFDLNSDFRINVADVLLMLEYLFQGGPALTLGSECVGIRDCPDVCGASADL